MGLQGREPGASVGQLMFEPVKESLAAADAKVASLRRFL